MGLLETYDRLIFSLATRENRSPIRRREAEMRHIAHWRSVKHVDEFTEEGEEEGETIIHKRERICHELTLVYVDGTIVELKATKEGSQDD